MIAAVVEPEPHQPPALTMLDKGNQGIAHFLYGEGQP